MKQTIKLRDIYAADLYTRSRAAELRSKIDVTTEEVELDFDQIGFMSRSFADELCNIIDDMKSIKFSFINRSDEVETMMNKVVEGRSRERKRGVGNAKIFKIKNLEELSKYFLEMA